MGRVSLEMSVLLLTLLSTALAVPAPCPPMPPMDCGEGSINCPGPIDSMGCMMAETCMAEGDECPFFCPHMPPMDCGEGMINCPGPIDSMGCMMPETCMAEGDECPFHCAPTATATARHLCHPPIADRVCSTAPVTSTLWAA